jgi:CPA2 family monovalent cation:H+ antiporter-2
MAEAVSVSPALSDALTILGAAGIVIPTFARFKVSPVIGFILVGIMAGPQMLGGLADSRPWLQAFSITDPAGIAPFAEFGIVLLLFSIGLELSFKRLAAMRKAVFGVGAAELFGSALLIGALLVAMGNSLPAAIVLGFALAMSSTALVVPIAGLISPVGRAAFAMLLFEDIALVPLLFLFGTLGGAALDGLGETAWKGAAVIAAMLVAGRLLLPPLFAQAARTKSPELFLSISLLVVILSSLATAAVGLSPLLGALIAGVLIAETDYGHEVELHTAPFRGLALGIFLISVGLRLDLALLMREWPRLLLALVAVLGIKALVTAALLRLAGSRAGVAAETGLLMASPSETTLILLGAGAAASIIRPDAASFWEAVTALGLTVTPLLAAAGRAIGRRADRAGADRAPDDAATDRTVLLGFGRVGRMVADMLDAHGKDYLAIDSDVDAVGASRKEGYDVMFGDVARPELIHQLREREPSAFILTMDNPVLVIRLARTLRRAFPDLAIVARARDTAHAADLYKAGVTDAVPETLEASLQLAEAALVDLGVPMGPVIASIHEKRDELRAQIKAEAELEEAPRLGGRRLRDAALSSSPLRGGGST